MKLLRLHEVGRRPDTKVFRESVLRNFLGLVLVLGMLGGLVAAGVMLEDFPLFITIPGGLLLALMALLAYKSFVRSLAPANWVMMIHDDGVRVKLTSYLNAHLYEGMEQVVFVPFPELASAGARSEKRTYTMRSSRTAVFARLELELAPTEASDIETLAKALGAVRNAKASSMFVHYPVSLSGNVLRIEWRSPYSRVTPSARRALRELSRHVSVRGEG